ncbi:MAG TPA: porin family protein [Gemmatimonadaceae bacterium]|nr:porin family protein [Gemmatimonadaceae bacterium]
MKRTFFAAALAGVVLISFEAHAQSAPKSVQFGGALGVAIPLSDLKTCCNTGFNGTAIIGFQPSLIPLGVRIDGAYNQFGAKGGGANSHFTSVTGNLVYKMPSTSFSPYLIGGAGWYQVAVSASGFGTVSENHFGWNAGAGISMPLSGFETFVEARYNQVQMSNGNPTLKFIPITFGVLF